MQMYRHGHVRCRTQEIAGESRHGDMVCRTHRPDDIRMPSSLQLQWTGHPLMAEEAGKTRLVGNIW